MQNETTDAYYALSAFEGLELLTKYHFCLVIMDICLSEANGMELLKTIRQIKPIPIFVLSSKPGSADRVAALKAGAHGYMEKPYQLEECLAHAQSLMELYAQLHTVESISEAGRLPKDGLSCRGTGVYAPAAQLSLCDRCVVPESESGPGLSGFRWFEQVLRAL